MLKSSLPLCLCAAALAVGGCDGADTSNNAATAQPEGAQDAAGEQTIAASIEQDSRFFQAARAVGLDATLAGPGPYTVLVPSDEAFAGAGDGPLANPGDSANRSETTRILTYHILPGVILAEDINTAIQNGDGSAVLATMGGETLTAAREGDSVVLTDGAGGKATITAADQQASNGVVHRIDAVLMPPEQGEGGTQDEGAAATNQQ